MAEWTQVGDIKQSLQAHAHNIKQILFLVVHELVAYDYLQKASMDAQAEAMASMGWRHQPKVADMAWASGIGRVMSECTSRGTGRGHG